jgi:hypothetical protein
MLLYHEVEGYKHLQKIMTESDYRDLVAKIDKPQGLVTLVQAELIDVDSV